MRNRPELSNSTALAVPGARLRVPPATAIQTSLPQTGPWLAWISVPVLVILLVTLIVGSLNNWVFYQSGYWAIQRDWFLALNTAFSAWPDQVWTNLTELGSGEVLILLLAPLLIRHPRSWVAVLLAAPVAAILSATIKSLAAVPRPAAVLDHNLFSVIGETLSGHHSFPSGHSITIFAAAIAFLASSKLRPQHWQQWLLLIVVVCVALVVCLSRVAVGAHWPLDLPVGGAIGWMAGLSGARLARRHSELWKWSQRPRGRRLLGAALLCATLSLVVIAQTTVYAVVTLWSSVTCGIVTSLWLFTCKSAVIPPPSNGDIELSPFSEK
jgi:membrane-associated phospholipid phosphatase